MAAAGCVFHRTLTRSRPGGNQVSSCSPAICRESIHVLDLQRYSRDQGSAVYFPQAVLNGDDLYDLTLSDGDCRLRVTLDPGLNRLVERHVLRPGISLHNAAFSTTMAAQFPACRGATEETDSYRLVSAEVRGDDEGGGGGRSHVDWDSLPWFGSLDPAAGELLPLRANRTVFLPLWNNVDYSGAAWREAPPTEGEESQEEEELEEEEDVPSVCVSALRESFLSGRGGVARGVVQYQLIVRIINKSHLMYYGRTERNCECPYKAVLEVCDQTGSVCVVLWNSACVRWYRCLKPGDIISLRRYRVKRQFGAEPSNIELSVNSRNPAARIIKLPQSSAAADTPPDPQYSFCSSEQLRHRPHGAVCDVIGLLTFSGRPERIRSKDGRGAELLEYRWLRLEDGDSDRPIMVKLFCTSQPETHKKLHPLCVLVCTRLKLVSETLGSAYLTNTTHTQVYCTGLGHHSEMSYRKLRPVRRFLQWLRTQDDGQVLSRALIGGYFVFPPPPVSLETYMKERRGQPGFLRGAELQRETERLCYRERRSFCIQATVTMVTYSCRGEEDRRLFWTHPSSSDSSPRLSKPSPLSSPSSSFSPPHLPLSPSPSCSSFSPSSAVSPPPSLRKTRKRRQQLQTETPAKRRPLVTLHPEHNNNNNNNNNTVILFEASMEFLENEGEAENNDSEDDDDDVSSLVSAAPSPSFTPVSMETLPMRYDHAHREEQAAAVAMGGRPTPGRFDSAPKDYYTLRLRALSDGVLVDVIFLPHSSSSSSSCVLPHTNTWTSILSHGAFSSDTPPPSPGDLVAMAPQLTNQRLVCVLEACHLGGATTEVVLSRAYQLPH